MPYSYDRRTAGELGTLGVSLEQVTSAVHQHMGLPPGSVPNIMFGVVSSGERALYVAFQAFAQGRTANGRVVFELLEANSRIWGGSAILLSGRVEIDQ